MMVRLKLNNITIFDSNMNMTNAYYDCILTIFRDSYNCFGRFIESPKQICNIIITYIYLGFRGDFEHLFYMLKYGENSLKEYIFQNISLSYHVTFAMQILLFTRVSMNV
jgi:hypothetical protein